MRIRHLTCVHEQMPFAAFDLFGGIVTDQATVTGGFDALTLQNGGGGAAALAVASAHEDAQGVMDNRPLMIGHPLPEDVINGFPVGKVGGQIAPRTAALDEIKDGIDDSPPIFGRASAFGGFGEQRLEVSPLGIGQIGVVFGDFHRLNCAAAKPSPENPQSNQGLYATIFQRHTDKPIFQTGSKVGFLLLHRLRPNWRHNLVTPAVVLDAGDLVHGIMEGQTENLNVEVNRIAGKVALGRAPVAVFDNETGIGGQN